MYKYKYKIGQLVRFEPEEGVVVIGKVRSAHVWNGGFKKGGEMKPPKSGYQIVEEDGTIWDVAEKFLEEAQ